MDVEQECSVLFPLHPFCPPISQNQSKSIDTDRISGNMEPWRIEWMLMKNAVSLSTSIPSSIPPLKLCFHQISDISWVIVTYDVVPSIQGIY